MSRERLLATTFVELADTLVTDFDAIDLMHTLTDRTVDLLGASAAGLIVADQRGVLRVVATTSDAAQVIELFQVQAEEGPCLECVRTGRPLLNLDTEEVGGRWPRFWGATREAGFGSTHALPMRLRDQVIGALNLFYEEAATLSEDGAALAQALADVATIGLLHDRVVREHELLTEQLQTALNSRILIEQATGMLAERARTDVDEAFRLIRNHSRRTRRPLSLVARDVISGEIDVASLQR